MMRARLNGPEIVKLIDITFSQETTEDLAASLGKALNEFGEAGTPTSSSSATSAESFTTGIKHKIRTLYYLPFQKLMSEIYFVVMADLVRIHFRSN